MPRSNTVPERVTRRFRAKSPEDAKLAQQIALWRSNWVAQLVAANDSRAKLDLAAEWIKLQHAADRSELEKFFELHSPEQLDRLGQEFSRPVVQLAGKERKVAALLNSARAGRILPLPKSLAERETKSPRAKETKGVK